MHQSFSEREASTEGLKTADGADPWTLVKETQSVLLTIKYNAQTGVKTHRCFVPVFFFCFY